jgi:chitin synthase
MVIAEDDMLSSASSDVGSSMILMTLVATYGVHVAASILYMDPLHVLTSTWAYFSGTTCVSNILMVYAFCNWHDVSIGTNVVDKSKSLPEAQTQRDEKSRFIEEFERPQIDIDSLFQATVKRALATFEAPPESEDRDVDDVYKAFRTYLVLLWVFSNLIMVLCIMSTGISRFCLNVGARIPWYTVSKLTLFHRRFLIGGSGIICLPSYGELSVFRSFALLDRFASWPRRPFGGLRSDDETMYPGVYLSIM